MPRMLPVTVDKSHVITIGERLYSESIELIRELVNNAYDADAARVEVTVTDDLIEVKDDGSGMDYEGLKQYFSIGSQEKLIRSRSPKFGRERIGQFGIGKFASLAAASRFEVLTQRGEFAARVTFDKKQWEQHGDTWNLPLEDLPRDTHRGDGTTVRLLTLKRNFDPSDVEKKIIEGTPIKAPNFAVLLNGHAIVPLAWSGHRIPILQGTVFGPVQGEIMILPSSQASPKDCGIEVKVKQATVKRELLGMESWGPQMARVRGEIHADFLPVTSDRTGFVTDSPEYQAFLGVMEKTMEEVKDVLKSLSQKGEKRKASRALREALERIRNALVLNPEYSPFGPIPIGDQKGKFGEKGALEKDETAGKTETIHPQESAGDKRPRKRKPAAKRLSPDAVVKKLRIGQMGISCCVDHFGEEGPEVQTTGTVIYINMDHPLYRREARKPEAHVLNLTRLIAQEVCMMKDPRSPRQAFERQSRILKDAFTEKK